MKKLHNFLRKAHQNQNSMIKLQLTGFGLVGLGLFIAVAGNWAGSTVGTIILISGLAIAAVGGTMASWGSF